MLLVRFSLVSCCFTRVSAKTAEVSAAVGCVLGQVDARRLDLRRGARLKVRWMSLPVDEAWSASPVKATRPGRGLVV